MDNEWRVNGKNGAKVDFNLVADFIDDIMSARIKEFVTSDLSRLGKYGLEPAVANLECRLFVAVIQGISRLNKGPYIHNNRRYSFLYY